MGFAHVRRINKLPQSVRDRMDPREDAVRREWMRVMKLKDKKTRPKNTETVPAKGLKKLRAHPSNISIDSDGWARPKSKNEDLNY